MERRRHPRIPGEIRAGILINGETNTVATVRDLSASGLNFEYDGDIAMEDGVIAYLDGGARLEGKVVRLFDGGFAISLSLSEHKRKRLAETLDRARAGGRQMNQLALESRLGSRVSGMRQSVKCEVADKQFSARIVDLSLSGVAIETDERLALDAFIVIGRMRGTVVRKEGSVYGVQFLSGGDTDDINRILEETAAVSRRA
ncbi:MAG: PilZ domain-containing protein [Pseudomonadota bacterium]